MPFVDLSSPDNLNEEQSNAAPVATPLINQSVSVASPVIAPPVSQVNPTAANNTTSTQSNPSVSEEHTLMRDVPKNNTNSNTKITDGGVKEMAGPPLTAANNASTTNSPTSFNTVNPVVDIKPTTEVATNNTSANTSISGLPPLPDKNTASNNTRPVEQTNQGIQLTGSAKGKENEVAAIFKQAEVSQVNVSPVSPTINNNNVKPKGPIIPTRGGVTTADEKFLNQKATLGEFLTLAEKRDASDLHLSVDNPPLLRVDGQLISLGGEALTEARVKELFSQILTKQQQAQYERDLDIDFSLTHTSGTRFRINLYRKKGSLAGAFRLIPSRIRTIAELGLPNILYEITQVPQGLVILAGPTGSGKSTTIASMVQEINLNSAKHIITIEDPIEYIFPRGKALVNQREIGTDAKSFKRALREVLREDPDVVLVGEMRDFEAISMTITTAETGHLVFSTLHTNSASQTVDRMIDVFPDAQQAQVRAQLANVLSAVVSQRLVPIKGGGRKAVLEVMIATPAIRNAIREAKTYQIDNMIQTNSEIGMITLEKSLVDVIRSGQISLEDAQTYTTKPDELISLMKNN